MAPLELNALIAALPEHENGWGPPASIESTLNEVPYAPYSKGDKLGRMADWTTEGGKDGRDQRGGRQGYNRNYRDQQVYGAGTSSLFSYQHAEDEASFSVVDNQRTSTKTRTGFGGRMTTFRGRGRGGAGAAGGELAIAVVSTIVVEGEVVAAVSAGKTTTSHSATVMPRWLSSLNGGCSRKSISTAWLSSILRLMRVKMWTTMDSYIVTTVATTKLPVLSLPSANSLFKTE
ncbi:unnamed protein product [Tuber melanosporum]|uniref:(Perigord truffle) hypothetical protein n=1 Tax=Tuber melanosporum (strain Mel28) TaxID=656061 RepID=D5GHL9_TUBMM|nr:uncharacterized protein GSTUM_00008033001 [Tuber melanosporum]CAZ84049.1 unnamed protein product [Tuber melanosporum]